MDKSSVCSSDPCLPGPDGKGFLLGFQSAFESSVTAQCCIMLSFFKAQVLSFKFQISWECNGKWFRWSPFSGTELCMGDVKCLLLSQDV